MFLNYLKSAWRNLSKNKAFSFVNISGLTIGMSCTILLLSYVSFEYSYDRFHSNKQNIYRIALDLYQNGNMVLQSAENYSALAPTLKREFHEVIDAARLYNMGYKNNCIFSYGNNKSLKETKFLFADPSFFTMFSFPFIQGNPETSLDQPNTAVISETTAKKMFGIQSAIGKFLRMDDDDRNIEFCKITGVFKDIPENSHLKFNIVVSYSSLYHRNGGILRFENNWKQKDFYTYILLRPGSNLNLLQAKLSSLITRQKPEDAQNHNKTQLVLQPLQKIHLTSNRDDEDEPNGNEKSMIFLIIIAVFIILIAWVNYINLTTANSMNRAKEIGIRKVLGSERSQLVKQFLIESMILNSISGVIAVGMAVAVQPFLNRLFSVNFPVLNLFKDDYGLIFILFLCFGAVCSALYPAFFLSSLKPVLILKGKINSSRKGINLRKSLVVFQFSLSIFLIIGTLIVYRQVNYMMNQNLGMNVSQVLIMDRPGRWDTAGKVNGLRLARFKELINKEANIESIGMSDAVPGKEIRSHEDYRRKEAAADNPISFNTIGVDEDYLKVLGLKLLAGRNFSKKYKTDENSLIVTESAARKLGYLRPEEAVGKLLIYHNKNMPIIGVINDFHHQSLENTLVPIIFQFNGIDYEADEYYLVKVKTADVTGTINRIHSIWDDAFVGNPFNFFFLDNFFNQQYKSQIEFGILFGFFSIMAIAIACIGLFALVSFMVRQRTKEIAVRKVLGANLTQIMVLLTRDFVQLILLSNIIAWPLGWLLMNNWLKDFAYRIHINWWVFGLSGLVALVIALATISFQAFRASTSNPIKTLRTE